MGALKRLFDISKAAVNETLDKLEQPGMMLNHYVRNMEEEIHSIQQAFVKESANQRMLEQQELSYKRLAERSEQQASEAMANDRVAEARQALESKLAAMDKAAEYRQAYEASEARTAELERQLQQAKAEYAGMQAKRDELAVRAGKVETQARTQAFVPGYKYHTEAGSAARGFQRIEQSIMQKEAQVELVNSMNAAAAAAREALIQEQLTRLRNNAPHQ